MPPPPTFVTGFPIPVPLSLPPPHHHHHHHRHQRHVNKRPRTGLPKSLGGGGSGSSNKHTLHCARSFARPRICCTGPPAGQQHDIEHPSDVNANSIINSTPTSTSIPTSGRRLTSFVLAVATATGVLLTPIPGIGQQSQSQHPSNSSVDRQRHQATAVRVVTAVACGSVVARSVTRVVKKRQSKTDTDEGSTAVITQQEYTDKNNNDVSKNNEWQQQEQENHDFATSIENDIVNDFLLLDDDYEFEHKPGTPLPTTNSVNSANKTATETTLPENPNSSSNVNVAREEVQRPSRTYSYAFKNPSRKNNQPSSSTEPSGGSQSASSSWSSTGTQSSTDEHAPSYDKDKSSSEDTGDTGSFSFSHMRAEFLAESSTSSSSSSTPSPTSSYESTASTSADDVEQSWFQNDPLSSASSTSNPKTSASTGSSDDSSDIDKSVNQESKPRQQYARNSSSRNNSNSSSISRTNNRTKRRVTSAGPVSSGELVRHLLGAPVVFLRDVVAPTADLVSVGWHDLRVNVEDLLDGKLDRVVLSQGEMDDVDVDDDLTWERDMMSFRDDWDWVKRTVGVQEGEEEGQGQREDGNVGNASNGDRVSRGRGEQFDVNKLSVEERQILRVQNMARSMKNGLFSQLDKFIKHRNNT